MMKRLFLIIAFWAAGVAGASAQMRLTLPQALDLALSENPTVKVAEMEVQRYDYVKRQTWGTTCCRRFRRRAATPVRS